MLAKSKAFMQNAIDLYGLASPLLRDTNRSEDRLFSLSTDDYQEEEDFREDLSDLDEAIQGPIDANDDDSVDLSMLFAGKVDLPDLLPALDGDKFTTSDVPDPTMGGLLPNWDQRRVRQEMLDADLLTYAPTSLLGQKFRINEVGYTTYDYFFNSEDAYFWDTELATPKLRAIPYTYEKNSSKEASLSLNQDFGIVTHQVTFASALEASSTWEDNDSSGIGSIQVLSDDYAPDSLIGWTLEAGTGTSYQFTSSKDGVFYYKDDTNDSNSELSTITYNWEVAGPSMGKFTTSLDETTWLFFDSNTTGYFDWQESGSDDGDSGEFTLSYYGDGNAQESLVGDSLTLGDTTYVFSSNTSVTIHTSNGTTTSEYTYLRNG